MANEIYVDYESGNTLYAVIRNNQGQVLNAASEDFEDWGTDGHNADDYDIALNDKGGDLYLGNFGTNIPVGRYRIQIFLQAGANPADSDDVIFGRQISWAGVAELTAQKLLANKAVQDKATGAISYYDDDGNAIILTLTPTDTASCITRTPG